MKIAVLVECDDSFKEVFDLTFPILQEYCDRHGYDLLLDYNPQMNHDRGIVWHRVKHILEHINDLDWLVHVDADVLVTNLLVPLTEFIDDHYSIILSSNIREDGSVHLNDGVMLVKGFSDWSQDILGNCWNIANSNSVVFCAQDGLEAILNEAKVNKHMKIEPQKRFNSFLYQEYGMPVTTKGQWTKGDFALHLPGVSIPRRVEIFRETEIIR